jgi:antirestriction protein ArdC
MNVYDVINSRIMELLEQGTVPWRKPWNASINMPRNISGRGYRGINIFMLSCSPYSSPYWLTFNQVQDKGGRVIKGSKSTPVIFWKWLDKDDGENSTIGKIPMLRYYNVFNVEQCEGIESPPSTEVSHPFTPIERAELILLGAPMKPEVRHGGNRACYSPSLDYIQMPQKTAFNSAEEYYGTLFHELGHATGHAKRLARKSILEPSYFGSHDYSKEELVAECCSSFVCGHAGIESSIIENSAAYIKGWLKALKNDKTLLVQAAGQAQKASDYILNFQPTEE